MGGQGLSSRSRSSQRDTGLVSFETAALPEAVVAFLTERHLASLTTLRADGSPHVTPVGFTYDPEARLARVITFAASRKIAHLGRSGGDGRVALCQVDGGRWLTLEGRAVVTDDAARVAEAVRRYAQRYRQPSERADRVAVEITVERILGRAGSPSG